MLHAEGRRGHGEGGANQAKQRVAAENASMMVELAASDLSFDVTGNDYVKCNGVFMSS